MCSRACETSKTNGGLVPRGAEAVGLFVMIIEVNGGLVVSGVVKTNDGLA